jgi:hypothetical protein
MCLIPEKQETTTEKKVVYVVRIIGQNYGVLYSPFYQFSWKIHHEYEAKDIYSGGHVFPDGITVNDEYFHVLTSMNDAYKMIEHLINSHHRKYCGEITLRNGIYCICEAIIPAGSKIVYGKTKKSGYGGELSSIATEKLSLTKILWKEGKKNERIY